MVQSAVRSRRFGRAIGSALLLLAGAWAAVVPASTTLYKWTDENGVVHYSDQPHQGAEKIQVAKAQSYAAPPVARQGASSPPPSTMVAGHRYQRVQITSPVDGDVLLNTAGQVPVSIDVEPGLAAGHQIWLSLDGQRVDSLSGPEGTLSGVDRGAHTLTLQIVDAAGAVVAQGDSVSFTVRQPSAIRPNQAKPAGN